MVTKAQGPEMGVDTMAGRTQSQREGWTETDSNMLAALVVERWHLPRTWERMRAHDLVWREANRQIGEILGVAEGVPELAAV